MAVNEQLCKDLMEKFLAEGLGLDLTDPNLAETPARVSKMFCRELLNGIDKEYEGFTSFPNEHNYDQIIISDNIHFSSICSHHLNPFIGKAWVLYMPDLRLIGLSKMARMVEHYAARPQLQENLCHNVMNCLVSATEPKGAMVLMRATHSCMTCRGVKQYAGAGMITSAVYGSFLEGSVKLEALELIKFSILDRS